MHAKAAQSQAASLEPHEWRYASPTWKPAVCCRHCQVLEGCNVRVVGSGLTRAKQELDMLAAGLGTCQRPAPDGHGTARGDALLSTGPTGFMFCRKSAGG